MENEELQATITEMDSKTLDLETDVSRFQSEINCLQEQTNDLQNDDHSDLQDEIDRL